jgi:hypothetical protein
MEFENIDITEGITVLGLIVLAGIAIAQGADELASALGGGLVGYLTKTAVNAVKKPPA